MTQSIENSPVTMEWLMEDAIQNGAGVSMARMTVNVDVVSELHSHSNCTEAIHVLEGKIEQLCGNNWVKLQKGQTCLIPKGAKHQTRNIGRQRAVLMIAYSSGSREYET